MFKLVSTGALIAAGFIVFIGLLAMYYGGVDNRTHGDGGANYLYGACALVLALGVLGGDAWYRRRKGL